MVVKPTSTDTAGIQSSRHLGDGKKKTEKCRETSRKASWEHTPYRTKNIIVEHRRLQKRYYVRSMKKL